MTIVPHSVATSWLSAFASAFDTANLDALAELFLPDGWYRDLLVTSWDLHSLEGREKIRGFLTSTVSEAQLSSITLDNTADFSPRESFSSQLQATAVEFGFAFECRHGHGSGYVRLLPDGTDGAYRAWTVLMMLSDLHGHEEAKTLILREDVTGVPKRNMQKEFAEWVTEVEAKPYVLIVGAGQTGLHVAARFKQMNIPALLIDRTARVGDGWRQRYPSLTLHTPRRHHSLLYQSYPTNWPEYTPRDKLADWLEAYSRLQDLVVWTKAELQPHPTYDEKTCEWDVTIIRDGQEVKLRPAHIVLATGTLGKPNIPDFPGKDLFHGSVFHSVKYNGPAGFAGKRVVVIGAGNTSIDICQDLVLEGAQSVTMVQRSSTCVLSRDFVSRGMREEWPEDVPVEVSDFRRAAMPFGREHLRYGP